MLFRRRHHLSLCDLAGEAGLVFAENGHRPLSVATIGMLVRVLYLTPAERGVFSRSGVQLENVSHRARPLMENTSGHRCQIGALDVVLGADPATVPDRLAGTPDPRN